MAEAENPVDKQMQALWVDGESYSDTGLDVPVETGGTDSSTSDTTSNDDDSADGGSPDEDQDDSADQASSLYYAACDSGHHAYWEGPHRTSRDAAQSDADAHNRTCDARGALVM
jgi:hypothetical protein